MGWPSACMCVCEGIHVCVRVRIRTCAHVCAAVRDWVLETHSLVLQTGLG